MISAFQSGAFQTTGFQIEVAVASVRPPGGDDFPGHPGIAPRRVKDRTERRAVSEDDLSEMYDRIQGIEPYSKAARKAVKAVQKAVKPYTTQEAATPAVSDLDWAAIEADLRASIAIRKAWQIIQDEEEALIALLMAA